MAIIGELIKSAIDFTDKFVKNPEPLDAQQQVLNQLLTQAKDTAFGRHYQFERILNSADVPRAFAETVPVFDYEIIELFFQLILSVRTHVS